MSRSELAELEALLGDLLADPVRFTERVLQQLAERFLPEAAGGASPTVVPGFESAAHQALVDQNLLLAAALGACDCWGLDPACSVCAGQGRPGWTPPDPDLYAEYVLPAMVRVAAETTSGTPDDHHGDTHHGDPLIDHHSDDVEAPVAEGARP